MKTLKVILISAVLALILASCGDDSAKYQLAPPTDLDLPPASDTVPTIIISEDTATTVTYTEETDEAVTLIITPNGVDVSSTNYNIDFPTDPSTMYVEFDEQGNISFLKVNSTVLFKEATKSGYRINHNYVYVEGSCIEIQPGNTLDAIIQDHRRMGYNITKKGLMKCNKSLNKLRKNNDLQIQTGQIICLECN